MLNPIIFTDSVFSSFVVHLSLFHCSSHESHFSSCNSGFVSVFDPT